MTLLNSHIKTNQIRSGAQDRDGDQPIERPEYFRRNRLPSKAHKFDFCVWSFVKQCIGKDLTKISMPVTLNEPISFLQRLAECMEYAELLTKALEHDDPVQRMEYICAFAVSATSSNHNRIGKPFNPLLGETYELHHDQFIFVAEQVSHHPPVTAFHVESADYRLTATTQFKLRFWGKSIEVQPKGTFTLTLHNSGEVYTWQNPNLTVHNLLMGKLWIEQIGTMLVTNQNSGHSAQLDFRSSNQISGPLMRGGKTLRQLFGNWTRGLYSVDSAGWATRDTLSLGSNRTTVSSIWRDVVPTACSSEAPMCNSPELGFDLALPNQKCLWRAHPRPDQSEDYYNFTLFTIGLNELTAELVGATQRPVSNSVVAIGEQRFLPPTDCRFRPDIRALESGDLDFASSEKHRLEEKQRHTCKLLLLNADAMSNGTTATLGSSPTPIASVSAESTQMDVDPTTPRVGSHRRGPIAGPIWFHPSHNPITKQEEWLFSDTYWTRDWRKCPDIY